MCTRGLLPIGVRPGVGGAMTTWRDDGTRKLTSKGDKAIQLEGSENEERTWRYRKWRRNVGDGCYAADVDFIEWRFINGQLEPVALIELSRIDGEPGPALGYFQAVLDRLARDAQLKTTLRVAECLGVDAFMVLFHWDLSEFHVYNLTRDCGWFHADRPGYTRWLHNVGQRERKI